MLIGEAIEFGADIGTTILSLFGKSAKDIENDKFLDSLVLASQRIGISGLTRSDVQHVMPGGWGENKQGAVDGFQYWVDKWTGTSSYHGVFIQPGQSIDEFMAGKWAGGYVPGHKIYYTKPVTINQSPTVGSNETPPLKGNISPEEIKGLP